MKLYRRHSDSIHELSSITQKGVNDVMIKFSDDSKFIAIFLREIDIIRIYNLDQLEADKGAQIEAEGKTGVLHYLFDML